MVPAIFNFWRKLLLQFALRLTLHMESTIDPRMKGLLFPLLTGRRKKTLKNLCERIIVKLKIKFYLTAVLKLSPNTLLTNGFSSDGPRLRRRSVYVFRGQTDSNRLHRSGCSSLPRKSKKDIEHTFW